MQGPRDLLAIGWNHRRQGHIRVLSSIPGSIRLIQRRPFTYLVRGQTAPFDQQRVTHTPRWMTSLYNLRIRIFFVLKEILMLEPKHSRDYTTWYIIVMQMYFLKTLFSL